MKSIKELSNELGVSERTVRRYMDKLKVKVVKQRNKLQFDEEAQYILTKAIKNNLEKNFDNNDNMDNCDIDNIDYKNNEIQPNRELSNDNMDNIDNIDNDNCESVALHSSAECIAFVDRENELKQQIEELKQDKQQLAEQLIVKDRQIESLQLQTEQLTKSLQQQAVALENTTLALTAAQALHAGTIQQQLTDKSSVSEADTEQATKSGFFQRLFRKT